MSFSDHPRYAQITSVLQTVIAAISQRQAVFVGSKGRYFQGIKIPATPQNGVNRTVPDVDAHPSDQAESWYTFDSTTFKRNVRVVFQVWIHVYNGPAGKGWVLIVDITYPGLGPDQFGNSGDVWRYMHHEGPESFGGPLGTWFIPVRDQR